MILFEWGINDNDDFNHQDSSGNDRYRDDHYLKWNHHYPSISVVRISYCLELSRSNYWVFCPTDLGNMIWSKTLGIWGWFWESRFLMFFGVRWKIPTWSNQNHRFQSKIYQILKNQPNFTRTILGCCSQKPLNPCIGLLYLGRWAYFIQWHHKRITIVGFREAFNLLLDMCIQF